MDITKNLFVLLTLFHNVISRYMKQESNDFNLKRGYCVVTEDCEDTYYCDYEATPPRCTPVKSTVDVMKKQKCSNIFKTHCKVNSDCPCNEAKMVCEDKECVYAKKRKSSNFPRILSPNGGPCQHMSHCKTGLCDNGICTNPKNIGELMVILQRKGIDDFKKCQVNSDCPPNKECRSSFCVRPNKKCHGNNCSQKYLS